MWKPLINLVWIANGKLPWIILKWQEPCDLRDCAQSQMMNRIPERWKKWRLEVTYIFLSGFGVVLYIIVFKHFVSLGIQWLICNKCLVLIVLNYGKLFFVLFCPLGFEFHLVNEKLMRKKEKEMQVGRGRGGREGKYKDQIQYYWGRKSQNYNICLKFTWNGLSEAKYSNGMLGRAEFFP